ncbi:hypothetical protein PEX1_004410 [Penicillium expansum]|uniref:Uncharacterized protein n=1 Tax=Penicillium expansum TaxID=27334 RepID=A0A0A2KAM7_PENEN|nr:hypothetical protein PEX2_045790 [Penicillium expansum]KGO62553.1 hypothetical protein PEX2_045790 [Penicillium expansum]KGO64864.1 hypothetical protein PEX1_004410 [Penicillium expansum]
MMPATPKEKAQASARLKDPAQAKQVKVWSRGDLLDVNSSGSTVTKKRKRGIRSRTKRLRMSSSMETISPESTTSKTSHKRSPKKEHRRDSSAAKSAIPPGMQQLTSPEHTQPELSPKASSEQKAAKDSASTKHTTPLELPDFQPSEFIFPHELELGPFDCSSDERGTSYKPTSDSLSEKHDEVPTPYTPALRVVSQYKQCISSQRGGKCDIWLARQMYGELEDISTRIEKVMHGITAMLEERGASDEFDAGGDFEGAGDYYFETEESPCASKGGGPENPLELSDGDDNALFVGSDERACSDEFGGLFVSE